MAGVSTIQYPDTSKTPEPENVECDTSETSELVNAECILSAPIQYVIDGEQYTIEECLSSVEVDTLSCEVLQSTASGGKFPLLRDT